MITLMTIPAMKDTKTNVLKALLTTLSIDAVFILGHLAIG